jgi:hypothetical protein
MLFVNMKWEAGSGLIEAGPGSAIQSGCGGGARASILRPLVGT